MLLMLLLLLLLLHWQTDDRLLFVVEALVEKYGDKAWSCGGGDRTSTVTESRTVAHIHVIIRVV